MRRPVKPFVTEYRGAARRQGGTSAVQEPAKPESERSERRTSDPWPSQPRPSSTPTEDGYEAALRAADALFAARPGQRATVAEPSAAEPSPGAPTPTSHPNGGRILRAIDELPSPELLRLEAERAPKRRGRKPGSKNKPKLPASIVDVAVEAAAEPVTIEPPSLPVGGPIAALPATSSPSRTAVVAGAKGERYAWVRTKLKPGQQWKRRLPKVAW